jgi:hypothetical protein
MNNRTLSLQNPKTVSVLRNFASYNKADKKSLGVLSRSYSICHIHGRRLYNTTNHKFPSSSFFYLCTPAKKSGAAKLIIKMKIRAREKKERKKIVILHRSTSEQCAKLV